MSMVFLLDAWDKREYAVSLDDRIASNRSAYAFAPDHDKSAFVPNETVFAFEESPFTCFGKESSQVSTTLWRIDINNLAKPSGITSAPVSYDILLRQEDGEYALVYQMAPSPIFSAKEMEHVRFPSIIENKLDRENFDPMLIAHGLMTPVEAESLNFPPQHGPKAEIARAGIQNRLREKGGWIRPLLVSTNFNNAIAAKQPANDAPKKKKTPPQQKPR